jgi:hypothetical protein
MDRRGWIMRVCVCERERTLSDVWFILNDCPQQNDVLN